MSLRRTVRTVPSLLLLSCFVILPGCLDRETDPVAPRTLDDPKAPVVVAVHPDPETTGVPRDQPLVVTFSEEMDATSLDGGLVLSRGEIVGTTWLDARTLRVDHDGWPEGARVEFTVGDGVLDRSGRRLGRPHTVGFWTWTPSVVVLATQPTDGAAEADRNANVRMKFSHDVTAESLADAVSVQVGPGVDPPSFAIRDTADGWIEIDFEDALPDGRLVTVTVAPTVRAADGVAMDGPKVFAFRTRSDRDRTPPRVVEIGPRAEGTIDPMTNGITVRFDEPIDPATATVQRMSAQLQLIMRDFGVRPVWSDDRTMMTLPLPTPLPPGLPLTFTFGRIADAAGNVMEHAPRIALRVEGTPALWPLVEGIRSRWSVTSDGDRAIHWQTIASAAGGRQRIVTAADPDFERVLRYEEYRAVDGGIARTAIGEVGAAGSLEPAWSGGHEFLRLPIRPGSWTANISSGRGAETVRHQVTSTVLGRENVPARLEGIDGVAWIDCWVYRVTTRTTRAGRLESTRTDTFHLAPGVGAVRRVIERQTHHDGALAFTRTTEDLVAIETDR